MATKKNKDDEAAKAEETAKAMHGDEPITPATKQEAKEIKIIERVIENREIAPVDAFGKLTRNQIELIKRTVAKGASDDELRMFIQVCKGANLNPFLKQVHLIPRWNSKEGREERTIQVSIDGFRAIAESSGGYAGNEDPVYGENLTIEIETGPKDKKNKEDLIVPSQATVTVFKIVEGQRYPFTATARWAEYYPGDKMGFQWKTRPFLMLGKCAEALALRKAFPKLLSGMYVQEEMDKSQPEPSEAQKTEAGFKKLMTLVQSAPLADLKDYKGKIEASDKYTKAQKTEFLATANKRIKELEELETIDVK